MAVNKSIRSCRYMGRKRSR